MRIFGREFVGSSEMEHLRTIEREFATVVAPPAMAETRGGAVGVDGADPLSIENALLGPDLNPELAGIQKYGVYNEMRLTDPACRSLLWLFKLPIRSARWGLHPAGEDPIDRLIRDATAAQFGLEDDEGWLNVSWRQSLAGPLLALDFGAHGEEIIWDDDLREWVDADGDLHVLRPIVRLAPRYASRFVDGEIETGKDGWISRARQSGREEWIPGSKLAWYRLEPEDPDWLGLSLLRAVYGPWKLKKNLMISAAIGWDRFAAGTPVIRYPSGGGKDAERRAETIGRNYRVHERAWIALEGPEPSQGEEGWSFKIESVSGSVNDPVPLLRHYDEQISTAGLQMFARLGTSERGSRAVGETLSDPYFLAVQSIALDVIAEERRRRIIRRFVDVNFGTQYRTPKLTVSKIQARSIETLARVLADLSSAGFSFADRATQNDVRDQLEFEKLPEPVQEAVEELPDDVGLEGSPPVRLPS